MELSSLESVCPKVEQPETRQSRVYDWCSWPPVAHEKIMLSISNVYKCKVFSFFFFYLFEKISFAQMCHWKLVQCFAIIIKCTKICVCIMNTDTCDEFLLVKCCSEILL